jgi:uncharacterized protein
VFWVMGLGLLLTGFVSLWISHDPALMNNLFHLEPVFEEGKQTMQPSPSGFWITCVLAELALVWVMASRVASMGKVFGYSVFILYAVLSGITMAPALHAYADADIAKVFFITSAMFAGSALYGHTTKKDLLPLGTFFLMGLIGLICAMVVNIFLQSSAMDYAICAIGVLLFAGLTAFDMQKLEALYNEMGASDGLVIYGGLTLYLDFVNMFLFILRFFRDGGDD